MIRRILRFIRYLITPRHPYPDVLNDRRARTLLAILLVGLVVGVLMVVGIITGSLISGEFPSLANLVLIALPLVVLGCYELVQRGYLRTAASIILVFSILTMIPGLGDGVTSVDALALVLPIVTAGVLLGGRATMFTLVIEALLVAQYTVIQPAADSGASLELFFSTTLLLLLIAFWVIVFSTNIQTAASAYIREMGDIREVVRLGAQNFNRSEMNWILSVINLIRDHLNYSYAQVYLVEGDLVDRRVTSGIGTSEPIVERDFPIQQGSAIYEAIRTRETVLIGTRSSANLRSHLLPGIQRALAIPILADEQVIGVLDIQQQALRRISDTQIETLELLARELGSAIQQQRSISSLRLDLDEQNRIIQRQRERLCAYERAEVERTTSAWSAYLRQRGIDYLGFDMEAASQPIVASDVDQTLQPALETGEISVWYEDDYQIISVPIVLRGRTLGAMSFKVPEGAQTIGPRQTDLIRSVVQRLALALENKRLFEQSQAQAQRESKANEVGSLLLSTTDVETVLAMAANNFNDALGAIQTRIHIQPERQKTSEESA